MGLGDVMDVKPGPFKRVPVTYSDGFKGTLYFVAVFVFMKHALCCKHLSNSIREWVKKQKAKGVPGANPGFADAQVWTACKADTARKRTAALESLGRTSPLARVHLEREPPERFVRCGRGFGVADCV
jgi:hypothetical protein